ncbi:MAG: ABC transporter ATP-binding protein [Gemmatimonadetes bacterium]|nr:ABC transporter ATP-binding protein [Gemmatimonadota bacterium]
MIRVDHVSKDFRSDFLRRRRTVVRELSFEMRPGETFALLGANGAGKTTTMKMILDLIRPDTGSITIGGIDSRDPMARSALGYLPEQPYFSPHLTGFELIRYYGALAGVSREIREERARNLIRSLGLQGAENRRIRHYSKGMMQRLGFAQVLISDPSVLVLDEPMSGLDPVGRKEIRDVLLAQKEKGKTILLSSHILEDVERICDRAGFLVEGRMEEIVETMPAPLPQRRRDDAPRSVPSLERLFVEHVHSRYKEKIAE